MQLPREPTLLQSTLVTSSLDDVERAWAFQLFCGLLESRAHDEFVRLAGEHRADVVALSDALLDFATQRAELLDVESVLAQRLWQYFQVGQSLLPDRRLGEELDEGTQPGISVAAARTEPGA
ncbi:MAG: hypothetical protein ACOZQL_14020 [Myxococcota bacterium]